MLFKKSEWLDKIHNNYVAATPYMLTDLGVIKEHCREFKKLLPSIKLYYAIKAFADKEIIKAIANEVDGFDTASIDEINSVLKLGIDPDRIIFSNPVKSSQSIKEAAIIRGVNKFTFQSREELEKIADCTNGADVLVRIRVGDFNSAVPLSTKFGCSPGEAVELMQHAKKLGLNPIGITFHVGSQQTGKGPWEEAIRMAQKLIAEARASGLKPLTINIGGGFPAQYSPSDISLTEVSKEINKAVNGKYSDDIKYMAEPGRYIVAESSVIVASIIGLEERQDKTWLWLDVGLFQAFVGATRFEPFPYPPFYVGHKKKSTRQKDYILTGPTCDSHDIITYQTKLPVDLAVDDRIAFPNSGAYTLVYGAPFNGFSVPNISFIDTTSKRR